MSKAKVWLHVVNKMYGGVGAVVRNFMDVDIKGYRQEVTELMPIGKGVMKPFAKKKYIENYISWLPSGSVVHLHCGFRSWLYSSRRNDIFQLITLHGFVPPNRKLDRFIASVDAYFLTKRGIHLVAVSETCRKIVSTSYPLDSLMDVIPNGTPDPKLDNSKSITSCEHLEVIFVGALWKNKGIETVIDVAKTMHELPVHFTIYGDGPEADLVKKACLENKNLNWVRKEYDPAKIYNGKDIMIFPTWFEGCPMVLLEAFSYGICCLASSIPSIAEVIDNEKDGLLIELKNSMGYVNKIKNLMDNRDHMAKLGQNAKQKWYQQYNSQRMVDQYVQLVRDMKHG